MNTALRVPTRSAESHFESTKARASMSEKLKSYARQNTKPEKRGGKSKEIQRECAGPFLEWRDNINNDKS